MVSPTLFIFAFKNHIMSVNRNTNVLTLISWLFRHKRRFPGTPLKIYTPRNGSFDHIWDDDEPLQEIKNIRRPELENCSWDE